MTEEGYDVEIERRNAQTKDIFEKAAKEVNPNHTMVGSSGSFSSYEPHNHRLYFSYIKPTPTNPQPTSLGRFIFLGSKNYGSETMYEDKETTSKIIIKKSQVEVRFKGRKFFLIDNVNPDEITKIKEIQTQEAINILKEFVLLYGGKTDFIPIKNKVFDRTIMDNSLTKQIPASAWWEDELTKKLYQVPNKIEAKTEQAAKNLIHNAALQDFNPKIEARLKGLESRFEFHLARLDDVLVPLTEQIKVHLEVENRTNELLKLLIEKETGQHGSISESTPYSTKPCRPSESRKIKNARDYLNECKGWFDGTI